MALTLHKQSKQIGRQQKRPTKKEQIIKLFMSGIRDIQEISDAIYSKTSYVASVLQSTGLIGGYYDLYNDAAQPMNAYSDLFKKRLGYRNIETALASVRLLHEAYFEFEALHDRAGQHHVMMLALKMFNRARWSGKTEEAKLFKSWLFKALDH